MPNDYRVNKQLQMMRFNGERWELFGPILEDSEPGRLRPVGREPSQLIFGRAAIFSRILRPLRVKPV